LRIEFYLGKDKLYRDRGEDSQIELGSGKEVGSFEGDILLT